MFHRSRVVASLVAAVFLAGAGALAAAPAFAADLASSTVSSSSLVTVVPMPVSADTTDQQPQSPGTDRNVTDTGVSETPVAEKTSKEVNPLILVAGLGVLFASILVVVRSGNKSNVGREH